jgi:hypothetical protein
MQVSVDDTIETIHDIRRKEFGAMMTMSTPGATGATGSFKAC